MATHTRPRVNCNCGGTHDGTPSGQLRHNATRAHTAWIAEQAPVVITPTLAAATAVLQSPEFAEAAGAMRDADATDGITPVTAPDQYASTPESTALYDRQRALKIAIAGAEKNIKKLQADRRWRESRAPHLVAKYDALIEKDREFIALWEVGLAGIAEQIEAIAGVRRETARQFWAGIAAEIDELFVAPHSDLMVNHGDGTFNLFVTTGKMLPYRDGDGEYPETRFGYEATIRAPERRYSKTDAATVNWGTIGSLSVADAKDVIRLHTVAVEIADYLDKRIALPAEAE